GSPCSLGVYGPLIAAQKFIAQAEQWPRPASFNFHWGISLATIPKRELCEPIGTGLTYSAVARRVIVTSSMPNTLMKKVGTLASSSTSSRFSESGCHLATSGPEPTLSSPLSIPMFQPLALAPPITFSSTPALLWGRWTTPASAAASAPRCTRDPFRYS